MNGKRLLILEPYFGGSHAVFIKGLLRHIPAQFQLLSLPARKWKMRMQLSAPWAFNSLQKLPKDQRNFNTVLCSTFMDVATLRALVTRLEGWNPNAYFCTYFHENQFAYPEQFNGNDNRQFAAINFNTALASDSLAFNSLYNRRTFLDGCNRYLDKAREMGVQATTRQIELKSRILHPGMDYSHIDQATAINPCSIGQVPVIVWNHRWEHDKNPDDFFSALHDLHNNGLDFRLILLGQEFDTEPACFRNARSSLAEKILHIGYASYLQKYADLLKNGSIVVSTAKHEFFGIAVLEAVRAGCLPLLPDRLAYPEIFEQKYLYRENDFKNKLATLLIENCRLETKECIGMTEKYSWQTVRGDYMDWLFGT